MRSRHDPLKWPFSIGLALAVLFAVVFLVPAAWFDFLFSPLDLSEKDSETATTAWLNILPPPNIEMTREVEPNPPEKDSPKPIPLPEDPRWWTEGWRIRISQESAMVMKPTASDSATVVLKALGLGLEFTQKALPDSVLNHPLMLLRIEDSFSFEELKPYLTALTRARAYADMKSREADMYDEHLGSQIMVPD
jgi:hypothetical protein